ncbi:MAG: Enoyl-CoA hydratase [Acidobacteriaceae bacterium]|nr:Enoyl-CoA hydratase [Acidobacteriaceae bacterium]
MTPEMQEELIAAFADAGAARDCRVVVLAGAGEAFCAGLDIEALKSSVGQSAEEHRADVARVARLFRALYELEKPTIAAVQGAAVAGGTGLATLCDFTLATPSARFGYTEVRIGFVPALVAAFLVLQVGEKRARELFLTGRIFGAEEALRLGLVTEVVAEGMLQERVAELAGVLVGNSPEAMGATKRLLLTQNELWLDAAITESLEANAVARTTLDFKEGVTAFLEKRKPVWNQ